MKPASSIKLLALLTLGGYIGWLVYKRDKPKPRPEPWPALGEIVHQHHGVAIYSNGDVFHLSHGKHYAPDGYYYGHKWQCVEFIKRYYYQRFRHAMPSPWGHAKHYFNTTIPHGEINPERNLIQFRNHHAEPPQPDDLLVWGGEYGHVAIIAEVHSDHIIIAQQNIKHHPLQRIPLHRTSDNNYSLGASNSLNNPLGWLRIRN